jgi:hypothetical protein
MAMYAEVGNLNPYALDYPVCLEDGPKKYGRGQRTWMLNHFLPGLFSDLMGGKEGDTPLSAENEAALKQIRKSIGLSTNEEYVPCAEDYMTSYLNQDSVKEALHVKSDIEWKDCSTKLR